MNDRTDIETPERKDVRAEAERYLVPRVDIYETAEGITLLADMPGVSKEHLDVRVEKDTLHVAGQATVETPQAMDALHADLRESRYQRSFTLSSELDAQGIRASLNDGVLTLSVPKRAEHQPRRIDISSG
ncbi:MAG: Hsp20/alpha crystallin family protein [Chromatiales bacterium]|nr:Hsp20/alpha crystallin family protein [Chromatiales bacterium]